MIRKIWVLVMIMVLPMIVNAKGASPYGDRLRKELPCILSSILKMRGKNINPEFPLPELILDIETDLKSYQDDVEPQWNMRPDAFVNVFVAHKNRIYLFTDSSYYKPRNRFVEDSLAHELHHFVQVFYDRIPLEQFSDFEEMDAVEIQNQFREKYQSRLKAGLSICEAP